MEERQFWGFMWTIGFILASMALLFGWIEGVFSGFLLVGLLVGFGIVVGVTNPWFGVGMRKGKRLGR